MSDAWRRARALSFSDWRVLAEAMRTLIWAHAVLRMRSPAAVLAQATTRSTRAVAPERADSNHIARLVGSVNALHQHTNGGPKLAKLDWRQDETADGLSLRVSASVKPQRVRAWIASSPTRDFRQSRWTSFDMDADGDAFLYKLPTPKSGCTAIFGEAVFGGEPLAYYLSTTMRIVAAK